MEVVVARLEVVVVAARIPLDNALVHNNDQRGSHLLACVLKSVDHNILHHSHKDHNHRGDDHDHHHVSKKTPSTYLLSVISNDLGHGNIDMKLFDTFHEDGLGKQWHNHHHYCQEYDEHNDILLNA